MQYGIHLNLYLVIYPLVKCERAISHPTVVLFHNIKLLIINTSFNIPHIVIYYYSMNQNIIISDCVSSHARELFSSVATIH